MKLYELIVKEIRKITDVIKKNTIAKVSLAVSVVLVLRKVIMAAKATP